MEFSNASSPNNTVHDIIVPSMTNPPIKRSTSIDISTDTVSPNVGCVSIVASAYIARLKWLKYALVPAWWRTGGGLVIGKQVGRGDRYRGKIGKEREREREKKKERGIDNVNRV